MTLPKTSQVDKKDVASIEPITSFAKHLKHKIGNVGVELMTITPAMAEEMLKRNPASEDVNGRRNRPLRSSRSTKYARQMTDGQWHLTFQPIIFTKSGVLQDGQHRLAACIIAGVPFQSWVAFGDEEENFAFIDVGGMRTAADIFAIKGQENYACAAAATRIIWAYDENKLARSVHTTGSVVAFQDFTSAELYEYYKKLKRVQDSIRAVHSFAQSRVLNMSTAAALHFICARKSREQADVFFEKLGSGVGIVNKQEPVCRIRDKLLLHLTSEKEGRLPKVTGAAYVIQAWNATRRNQAIRGFKWRDSTSPTEPFPKAI